MSFSLLSHLWLHEPDAAAAARAVSELGLPSADPAELALAYTDVFLLNVPPYGTAFAGPSGELNGPEAHQIAALYAAHGYGPPELSSVGAPDHLGLCLGFLARLSDTKCLGDTWYLLLEWAPVCCLAVEREPSAHPFYRALAKRTREALLAEVPIPNTQYPIPHSAFRIHHSEDEITLRDLVRFFLAPAQCGVFLSRSRLGQMARELGWRLPFGSRFEVAEALFNVAGEAEAVEPLIAMWQVEIGEWAAAYQRWAEECPAWSPLAELWLARTAAASRRLSEMQHIVEAERA